MGRSGRLDAPAIPAIATKDLERYWITQCVEVRYFKIKCCDDCGTLGFKICIIPNTKTRLFQPECFSSSFHALLYLPQFQNSTSLVPVPTSTRTKMPLSPIKQRVKRSSSGLQASSALDVFRLPAKKFTIPDVCQA
jgi:hypothetical protein